MVMPFSTFMTQMVINFKYIGKITINYLISLTGPLTEYERERPNQTFPYFLPEKQQYYLTKPFFLNKRGI
jgi:hypothetical protein